MQAVLDELQSKKVDDNTKARDLAYLNQVLLQCKGFLHRYSVRQDMMCKLFYLSLSAVYVFRTFDS